MRTKKHTLHIVYFLTCPCPPAILFSGTLWSFLSNRLPLKMLLPQWNPDLTNKRQQRFSQYVPGFDVVMLENYVSTRCDSRNLGREPQVSLPWYPGISYHSHLPPQWSQPVHFCLPHLHNNMAKVLDPGLRNNPSTERYFTVHAFQNLLSLFVLLKQSVSQ